MLKLKILLTFFAPLILGFTACRMEKSPALVGEKGDGSSTITDEAAKLSIAKVLQENGDLSVEERVALYLRLKKENPNTYNFENEDEMTMYGYSLLWSGENEEALAIFKLIVSQFPDSSNPYDSLGEAYMVLGNTEQAIANYEKSLELNPDNFNAEDQIELMKHPEKALEKPTDKFAKVFTAKEYREDLDQLGNKLLGVHPNALKFITEEDFWKVVEEKKSLVTDQTTYAEFNWHCTEIIANLNCSHTSMGRFNQENEMLPLSLRFPIQVRWVNDQLFVIDPLNNEKNVAIKDEILSINGVPVAEVIGDIYKHISSQGYVETTKKHAFNTWATGMIPFALGFPETYEVTVNGKVAPIVLNQAESYQNLYRDPSIASCGEPLCLEMLDNNKTAILTVSSFNFYPWNNLNVFEEYIDKSFVEITEKGVENLIVDVRFNGGGSPESSIYLLRYLVNQPFTYSSIAGYEGKEELSETQKPKAPFENAFKGQCYFLIDGNGNSTTGHFMSMVKVLNLGVIVGEELGSNQFCSAGQTVCRLSNTKLQYYVANNTHVTTATSLPDEVGILPDHYVTQGIDDYLNKVDRVKQFTIGLINE